MSIERRGYDGAHAVSKVGTAGEARWRAAEGGACTYEGQPLGSEAGL